MTDEFSQRARGFTLSVLRIMVSVSLFVHGAQKTLGWFGGVIPTAPPVGFMTNVAVIDLVAGVFLVLGLLTRPVALIVSVEMAVAYLSHYWAGTGNLGWWANKGETTFLYIFIWFLIAAFGAGPFSVDAWLESRRRAG